MLIICANARLVTSESRINVFYAQYIAQSARRLTHAKSAMLLSIGSLLQLMENVPVILVILRISRILAKHASLAARYATTVSHAPSAMQLVIGCL